MTRCHPRSSTLTTTTSDHLLIPQEEINVERQSTMVPSSSTSSSPHFPLLNSTELDIVIENMTSNTDMPHAVETSAKSFSKTIKSTSKKHYWNENKPLRTNNSHIPVIAVVCTIIGLLVTFLIWLIATHQIKSKQPRRRKKLMFHKKITVHTDNSSSRCLMKALEHY